MTERNLTTNSNGFAITISIGSATYDYTLATPEQREQFLIDLDTAMARRGFETSARWSDFQDTQIDGTSTYHEDRIEEQYPGFLTAYMAAYDEAINL